MSNKHIKFIMIKHDLLLFATPPLPPGSISVNGIDLQQAGKTDNLADTVNYVAVEAAILKLGRESRFFLLERFANEVCQIVFAIDERIQKICVTITKPGAITHAAGVGCHIERFR